MRFRALPVTSLEDATIDFEQLQTRGIDRLNSTLIPLTGTAWTVPTLINAWANTGGGFAPAGYLKDPLGFVHLRGTIVGTLGTIAFVLPAGFRPVGKLVIAYGVDTAGVGTNLQVDTAGNVTPGGAAAVHNIGLDVAPFLAEL